MSTNPYAQLEGARRRREMIRENSARMATSFVTMRSKGVGDVLLPDAIEFETPFFHEPMVVTGFHLEVRPDFEVYTMPRVSAGVYRWVRTDRGFHTGAFVYFTVDCEARTGQVADVEVLNRIVVVHHLQFSGTSYKPLTGQASAEVEDAFIVPLTPPHIP